MKLFCQKNDAHNARGVIFETEEFNRQPHETHCNQVDLETGEICDGRLETGMERNARRKERGEEEWPEHLVVQRGPDRYTVLDGSQDCDFTNCELYTLSTTRLSEDGLRERLLSKKALMAGHDVLVDRVPYDVRGDYNAEALNNAEEVIRVVFDAATNHKPQDKETS